MHDECKVFAKALENATEAIKESNEINKRFYKIIIFVCIAFVIIACADKACIAFMDYVQYAYSYNYPDKNGGDMNGNNTETTETTKAPETTSTKEIE